MLKFSVVICGTRHRVLATLMQLHQAHPSWVLLLHCPQRLTHTLLFQVPLLHQDPPSLLFSYLFFSCFWVAIFLDSCHHFYSSAIFLYLTVILFIAPTVPTSHNLTVLLQWHFRGKLKKFSEFKQFLSTIFPYAICLTETHIHPSQKLRIPGYHVHR